MAPYQRPCTRTSICAIAGLFQNQLGIFDHFPGVLAMSSVRARRRNSRLQNAQCTFKGQVLQQNKYKRLHWPFMSKSITMVQGLLYPFPAAPIHVKNRLSTLRNILVPQGYSAYSTTYHSSEPNQSSFHNQWRRIKFYYIQQKITNEPQ